MELLEGHSFAELVRPPHRQGGECRWASPCACSPKRAAGSMLRTVPWTARGGQLQIVHRDFTPDNIHVSVTGEVKVIDFGIAKSAAVPGGTEPGTLKGKFFYMSPEMIAGHDVDHRADLFAAGVMLYEQLCGRRPFTGLNTEEVLNRISEGSRAGPPSSTPPYRWRWSWSASPRCRRTRRAAFRRCTSSSPRSRRSEGRRGSPPRGGRRVRGVDLSRRGGPQAHRAAARPPRRTRPTDPPAPDAMAMDLLPPREESRPPGRSHRVHPGPSAWQRRMAWAREKVFRVEVLGPARSRWW
jgi:serine/threonine protein kinase